MVLLIALLLLLPNHSDADEAPKNCDTIFGLAAGTIRFQRDTSLLNDDVCNAYKFLSERYDPESCSQKVERAKVNGVTALDPAFAVSLAKMLKEMPGNIRINSAYRNSAAQQCANPSAPNSNHLRGCAVDLQYPYSDGCASAACQWITKNGAAYKLQIRMRRDKEWNHIEPIGTCAGQRMDQTPVEPPSTPSYQTPVGQAMQGAMCLINPQAAQCRGGTMMPQQMPLQQYPQQYAQPATAQPTNAFTQTPTTQPVSNTINTGSVSPSSNSGDGSLVSDFIDTTSTSSPCKQSSNASNDLLQALADPAKNTPCAAAATTSSTSIIIRNNSNLKDVQTIQPMATSGGTVIRYLNGGGGVYQLTPDKGNTFVSDDLRNTKSYIAPATTQSSTGQILSTLQNILSRLAVILTPFGGRIPQRAE